MKLYLLCNYCGHKFEKNFYIKDMLANIRCPICNDKNIDKKEVDSIEKIDQYKDDPVDVKKIDNNDDYDGYL